MAFWSLLAFFFLHLGSHGVVEAQQSDLALFLLAILGKRS